MSPLSVSTSASGIGERWRSARTGSLRWDARSAVPSSPEAPVKKTVTGGLPLPGPRAGRLFDPAGMAKTGGARDETRPSHTRRSRIGGPNGFLGFEGNPRVARHGARRMDALPQRSAE